MIPEAIITCFGIGLVLGFLQGLFARIGKL